MKKLLLISLLVFIVGSVYSQRKRGEVSQKILRNNPDNVNNNFIYANIASLEVSRSWFGFSGGVGAFYRFQNKFAADMDIRMSYVKPRTIEYKADAISNPSHEPYGGIKRPFNIEANAYYFIGKLSREGATKVVLESRRYSNTYTKVRHLKQYSIPLRLGFGINQSTIFNDETFNKSIELKGYYIGDPSQSVESLIGSANYTNHTINVGIGLIEITDIKVKVSGDYQGVRDVSIVSSYFLDFMIPVKQNLSDMIIESYDFNVVDDVRKQYHIDDHTTKIPFGFRFVYKYNYVQSPVSGGSKIELGVLPGPHDLISNIYISASMFIGFSPK